MILALVQARMGSTRLPGKVLAEVAGQPLLWHVVHRARAAKRLDQVVVATSTSPADDAIAAFCAREGIPCFRGSEDDVLDRFHQAARREGAAIVVRITADCPLIDPEVIDRVVGAYLEGGCDLASNALRYTYPDGLDTEVFSAAALERAWREARRPAEREHVTPYIRNSGHFRLRGVENERDLSREAHRWTVDHPQDLAFVRAVYDALAPDGRRVFGYREVLDLVAKRPTLLDLNRDIIRNEGAYKGLAKEPPVPPVARSLARSRELEAQGKRLIPSGTQTFSKGTSQFTRGVAPVYLQRGQGARVWDVDGNAYLDLPMGLGAVILGHADPAVNAAAARQLQDGLSFSLPHPLEVEVAQLLVDLIPCAEMVRFGKNGSDATAGAVRAARAFTGRDLVLVCGYHGWQDWFIGTTTRNKGVPPAVQGLSKAFPYNDLAALERLFAEHPGKVAAVVMEPVGVVPPKPGFLEGVRKLTAQEGALLVFDEIVTGFRMSMGGAQEYFGVTPDLACFGKAMGNGFPIATVVGRRDVMAVFDEIFFSFTFGGEAVSLAAANATIRQLQERQALGHIWEQGQRLKDGLTVFAREFGIADRVSCQGYPPRTVVGFKDASGQPSLTLKTLFQQECLQRGVLFSGGQNLSLAHGPGETTEVLRAFRAAMEVCAEAVRKDDVAARLKGEVVQPVFRQP